MHHQPREKAFGRAHGLKREVRDVVAEAARKAAHFVAEKCAEVYMPKDELNALNITVKTGAALRKDARAAPRFVIGQSEKTSKERERDEDENEMSHGV